LAALRCVSDSHSRHRIFISTANAGAAPHSADYADAIEVAKQRLLN
jgi:hypothetical protein